MVSKFQPQSLPRSVLPESRKTRPEPDPRLDAEERVFGLAQGEESRAWPLRSFGERPGLRKASVGGREALILWDGRTRTAAAYAPEIDGKAGESVTLAVDANDPACPWVDKETGSRWSVLGSGGLRPPEGADAPLAAGRDGQMVRLGGRVPQDVNREGRGRLEIATPSSGLSLFSCP